MFPVVQAPAPAPAPTLASGCIWDGVVDIVTPCTAQLRYRLPLLQYFQCPHLRKAFSPYIISTTIPD